MAQKKPPLVGAASLIVRGGDTNVWQNVVRVGNGYLLPPSRDRFNGFPIRGAGLCGGGGNRSMAIATATNHRAISHGARVCPFAHRVIVARETLARSAASTTVQPMRSRMRWSGTGELRAGIGHNTSPLPTSRDRIGQRRE
jgi:hypothetical protein